MVLELIRNLDTLATGTVGSLYSARPGDRVWRPRSQSQLLRRLHKKNRPYSKHKLLTEKQEEGKDFLEYSISWDRNQTLLIIISTACLGI